MQEDGRHDKSVACATKVTMIAIHRQSLYSHLQEWLEEDNESERAAVQERSTCAAHSFKVGSALWRPGMGLAIVDNVDVSKLPFEFWVVFRDGQTIKFLPDGMFTLFKKLPADSLRGDEIEQLRRSRMTMLLMHLMHLQGNVHTPESSQTAATTAEIAANAAETQQKMAERQLLKLVQISERLETLLSASHVSDQARTVCPVPISVCQLAYLAKLQALAFGAVVKEVLDEHVSSSVYVEHLVSLKGKPRGIAPELNPGLPLDSLAMDPANRSGTPRTPKAAGPGLVGSAVLSKNTTPRQQPMPRLLAPDSPASAMAATAPRHSMDTLSETMPIGCVINV